MAALRLLAIGLAVTRRHALLSGTIDAPRFPRNSCATGIPPMTDMTDSESGAGRAKSGRPGPALEEVRECAGEMLVGLPAVLVHHLVDDPAVFFPILHEALNFVTQIP